MIIEVRFRSLRFEKLDLGIKGLGSRFGGF